eukprot:848097-Prorocentrum_minimum.AAC.1
MNKNAVIDSRRRVGNKRGSGGGQRHLQEGVRRVSGGVSGGGQEGVSDTCRRGNHGLAPGECRAPGSSS